MRATMLVPAPARVSMPSRIHRLALMRAYDHAPTAVVPLAFLAMPASTCVPSALMDTSKPK